MNSPVAKYLGVFDKKRFKRIIRSVVTVLVGVYFGISAILYIFQPYFVYHPRKELIGNPSDVGLQFERIEIVTEDNIKIAAWFIPAENARATVLFCHGNAGNISYRLDTYQILNRLGLSTLTFDYRGFGESEGVPSEDGTYLDVKATWKYLINERDMKPENIIIFGRSLGGAMATWIAEQYSPKSVILESTFTSIADVGHKFFPIFPMSLLTRIEYDSLSRIKSIDCPILIIHSREDDLVPFELGQQLYEAAPHPKQLLEIHGPHNIGFLESEAIYENGLKHFLNSLEP